MVYDLSFVVTPVCGHSRLWSPPFVVTPVCGHSRLQHGSVFEISDMFDCKPVAKVRRNSYTACLISQNINDLSIIEKFKNL
jgi:hypothetical protein